MKINVHVVLLPCLNLNPKVLTSRLVDRSLRPLAPPGFHDEISIACNLLSLDQRGACDPEVLSVNAASLALALSTLPWTGAVGAVRVGLVGEEVVLNPTRRELKASKVNLVVVATSMGKCTMLEGEASRVPPEDFLRCINRGLEAGAEVARKVEEVTFFPRSAHALNLYHGYILPSVGRARGKGEEEWRNPTSSFVGTQG